MLKTAANPSTINQVERAVRDVEARQRREAEEPDLLVDGIKFTPSLWHIVIEPLKPRTTSDGGIEVVDVSQEAESYAVTIGRVLRCGPAAFEGRTTAGIDLSHFTNEISSPGQLIGKYVVYQHHVGQELTLRRTGQKVKVMKVTDLLGVTEDPHAWKFYI